MNIINSALYGQDQMPSFNYPHLPIGPDWAGFLSVQTNEKPSYKGGKRTQKQPTCWPLIGLAKAEGTVGFVDWEVSQAGFHDRF